jgi:hypothetical protein
VVWHPAKPSPTDAAAPAIIKRRVIKGVCMESTLKSRKKSH